MPLKLFDPNALKELINQTSLAPKRCPKRSALSTFFTTNNMIGGSYSDTRLVRFPSSFGIGPDNALMPTVLVIYM